MNRELVTLDANEAAAYVAHKTNEVIAIYPITPSSNMGEFADAWSVLGQTNVFGTVPLVQEMQSEGGAAGAVHGALQTGSLTTTFTASQGLLLMIPNMFKISGELTSTVFHIAARSLAGQALSIFGDHSDVMSTRSTGWAMLFGNSAQEVMDLALVAQAATLESRVPFLNVFDGFRTSHEVMKIERLSDEDILAMMNSDHIAAHRGRALNPDRPVIRGTAQNPDVFFQARETVNPYYLATPEIVQKTMDKLAGLVGRQYRLFDYVGAPDAERVIILMGSGCETAEETVNYLIEKGEKVGLLKVRLFRPFSVEHFLQALPATVRKMAVLDRTKEPGAAGEPLYQDVMTAVSEDYSNGQVYSPFKTFPKIIGGRYGLSSKEFTPAMVKGVFDELNQDKPKNHFTVGINDDVTHTSLSYDPDFDIEPDYVVRAMFWGLGADGTVGANKNSIKIIGEETPNYAQGYFVYDSKKSGARTVSHLRFGPKPIHSTYLIRKASFIAVHQFGFMERFDVLENATPGATFLLNSPFGPEEVWDQLPREVQQKIIAFKMKFYVIDGYGVAKSAGMGNRINTVMQTCFFAISGVLPREEAIEKIKETIKKTYGRRGEAVVKKNYAAVDETLANLHQVTVPEAVSSHIELPPVVPAAAPDFVQKVTAEIIAGRGDALPVSAMPVDGTFPVGTTQWEKRNIALEIPVWDTDLCIQCGKCVMVCPHAVIRSKVYDDSYLAAAPETFKSADARFKEITETKYSLQVSGDDCTGCRLCVEVCPVKDKTQAGRKALNMADYPDLREAEKKNWDFFLTLPEFARTDTLKFDSVKNVQLLEPLFEFSGACAGCGETPYLKLLSQLYGDRALIANATGCSSIYGGNLPTTPWAANKEGRGPAWSNSLFEDNAEFGLGMRLTLDKQREYALHLVERLRDVIGSELAADIIKSEQTDEAEIFRQRDRIELLKKRLAGRDDFASKDLISVSGALTRKSVWIVGGDGWAYDIGYGGLDHVLASGRNVNLLVLDTEVYSNTGGQSSKATPRGAVAKFAAGGKATMKKDLGLMAISYGNVYVAQIAMGGNDVHTIKAFLEAEAYDGPSLIIAYSHCIAHGIDISKGLQQQKLAVETAHWPLYRYNPLLKAQGKNPFQLDSRPPKIALKDYAYNETRYSMLLQSDPDGAAHLMSQAQQEITERWKKYEQLAKSQD
ncbi:MAG: pyruvate:ferredoxin (flavodoxin) oxidoreductase [Blastocatellia bacterium]|nr:pyruvate:ferredoxin (flavodoxin) oxidoreductase [Blastocatellia bacterium]